MSHGPISTPPAGRVQPGSRESHLDLLDLARSLAAHARADDGGAGAASADEIDALHDELCALRNALVEHVHAERDELARLSPAARTAVEEGQRRLLHQVEDIMASADAGAHCDCVGRSVHLVGMLATQARIEAGLLARHDRRRAPDG